MNVKYISSLFHHHTQYSVRFSCGTYDDGIFILIPINDYNLGIWNIQTLDTEPFIINGDFAALECLSLGNNAYPITVAAGVENSIFIWNIYMQNGILLEAEYNSSFQIDSIIHHSVFNENDALLACCYGSNVVVFNINEKSTLCILEGHEGKTTCAAFYKNYLITTSIDRTFKIWNLDDKSISYESCIMASALISIDICLTHDCVAFGSMERVIYIHCLNPEKKYKILHNINIDKIVHDYSNSNTMGGMTESEVIADGPILSLMFKTLKSPSDNSNEASFQDRDSQLGHFLNEIHSLLVVTSNLIVELDAHSFLPNFIFDITNTPLTNSVEEEKHLTLIEHANVVSFKTDIYCIACNLLSNEISILSINLSKVSHHIDSNLTVLSSEPLVEKSPLKAAFKSKSQTNSCKQATSAKNKQKDKLSKSLVFHQNIKSSGYSLKPVTKMFQPNSNSKTTKQSKTISKPYQLSFDIYPSDSAAPYQQKEKIRVAKERNPIKSISFSNDGKHLACGTENALSLIFKMPLTDKSSVLNGHSGAINNFSWSCDSKLLLSASYDKSACLWSLESNEPLINFNNYTGNLNSTDLDQLKTDKRFSHPITWGQFFYMDKFIILVSSNKFYLYKYDLDTKKCDIKRYINNNKYSLVSQFHIDNANAITAFSAMNTFHSHIALSADTQKRINVHDMNVGKIVSSYHNVHAKPLHVICQNKGSLYASNTSYAYDLFLTLAANDSIKLWDVRTKRCVKIYDDYHYSTYPCGIDISPCSRFICTGSVDKSVYLFDIRSSSHIKKIGGHDDTISDVKFHPKYAELLTSTLSGQLQLFKS